MASKSVLATNKWAPLGIRGIGIWVGMGIYCGIGERSLCKAKVETYTQVIVLCGWQ